MVESTSNVMMSAGASALGMGPDGPRQFSRESEFNKDRSNPGRGWIQVKATRLSQQDVFELVKRLHDSRVIFGTVGLTCCKIKRRKKIRIMIK